MSATMLVPVPLAEVRVVSDGRRWWHCPGCRRKMAEVVGQRVVIIRRDLVVSYQAHSTLVIDCPSCGEHSVLGDSC